MSTIEFGKLSDEVKKILENYSDDVQEVVKEEVKKVAADAVRELKSTSPKRTGKYAKGWTSKVENGRLSASATVYNSDRYFLTHLLEFGHAKRGGGRTSGTVPPYPHIERVNDEAAKKFEEGLLKRL